MSLKNVDITSALRRLADRRIEDAMAEGKFDNLPGMGQPLELEPMPADENTRLLWWALRIMKQNDVIPEEIQWRKAIEMLKVELAQTRSEARLKVVVTQINALMHKLNTLGTNALSSNITGVDMDVELAKLRDRCTS